MVVDYETSSMASVRGMRDSLRREGWFAVFVEMSVPLLVGGDLLQGHVTHSQLTGGGTAEGCASGEVGDSDINYGRVHTGHWRGVPHPWGDPGILRGSLGTRM